MRQGAQSTGYVGNDASQKHHLCMHCHPRQKQKESLFNIKGLKDARFFADAVRTGRRKVRIGRAARAVRNIAR